MGETVTHIEVDGIIDYPALGVGGIGRLFATIKSGHSPFLGDQIEQLYADRVTPVVTGVTSMDYASTKPDAIALNASIARGRVLPGSSLAATHSAALSAAVICEHHRIIDRSRDYNARTP